MSVRKAPKRVFLISPAEMMIAFRYLRARRKEAFISVTAILSFLGIMIGVTALIVVMAAMNGLRTEIVNNLIGAKGHILIQPLGSPLNDYKELSGQLEAMDEIKSAIPSVEGQVFVVGPYSSSGALIKGLDKVGLAKVPSLADVLPASLLNDWDDREDIGVILGDRLAANLGVQKGENLTIISPDGDETALGTSVRSKSYIVKDIFHIGQGEVDGFYIIMPLYESQLFFNKLQYESKDQAQTGTPKSSGGIAALIAESDEDVDGAAAQATQTDESDQQFTEIREVNKIEVFTHDAQQTDYVIDMIKSRIDRPLIINDWRQLFSNFLAILQVERVTMFIILSLIIIVAVFNIISGLFMLVKDKSRDIAILRTMGATRTMIMKIFCLTGSTIGIFATFVGMGLGLIIAYNLETVRRFVEYVTGVPIFPPDVFMLDSIPSRVDMIEVIVIVVISCILSVLATLYPARKASTLDPIEVLRYE